MMTYRVTRMWEHGWELHIDGVGVTQSHNLTGAERMVRDYLRLDLGDDVATDAVIEIGLDLGELTPLVERVKRRAELAAEEQRAAAEETRAVAKRLLEHMSGNDAAKAMGITPQRMSQLVSAK